MNKVIKEPLYAVGFEVSGRSGFFAEPASGSDGISYPVPPPTAVEGMIRGIYCNKESFITVVAVGICSMPDWRSLNYNSHATHIKPKNYKDGDATQIRLSILNKPRFQVLAVIGSIPGTMCQGHNPGHAMQAIVKRRIRKEQCFKDVFMGIRKFEAEVKTISTPVINYSSFIPSMQTQMFTPYGELKRVVRNNLFIKSGVIHYEESIPVVNENGILKFVDSVFQSQVDE